MLALGIALIKWRPNNSGVFVGVYLI